MTKRLIEYGMTLTNIRDTEVKTREQSKAIPLTANEWKKARRFGDKHWLYIVIGAGSTPHLHCIQNPAAVFRESEESSPPVSSYQRIAAAIA